MNILVTFAVQAEFTPQRVCAELRRLLPEGEARASMIAGFGEVRRRLAAHKVGGSASERAARAVLSVLEQSA